MNLVLLSVVIAIQIVVFQLLAVRWSKALPGYLVGRAALPEDVTDRLRPWEQRVGRTRRLLGVVLLAMLVVAVLVGAGSAWGKPVVALISIASAVVFLGGIVRDRAVLATLAEQVPPAAVRTAGLEPRSLGDAYAPAWEILPIAIVVLTWVATLRSAQGARVTLFLLPSLQLAVAVGGLAFSRWYARFSRPLSQRVRADLGDPDAALATDRWLRALELRAFLGAKIGIVVLLALKQAGYVLAVSGHNAPPPLEWAEWSVVAALLGVFGAYVLAVTRGPSAQRTPPSTGPVRGRP